MNNLFLGMLLSVVIVSYNVKDLLEQCLYSVQSSIVHLNADAEVIVVDNHSNDSSAELVRKKYPQSKLIINQENVGFAKASNQGARVASGKYILFLNPDTMIPEDCLERCVNVFDTNDRIGALGVRMVNGSGKYLPESKRG